MTQYVLVQLDITDETIFSGYREKAGNSASRYEGRQVAGGVGTEVVEDNGLDDRLSVLLTFPSAQHVRDWLADPELAPIHALRRGGAKTVIQMLTVRD